MPHDSRMQPTDVGLSRADAKNVPRPPTSDLGQVGIKHGTWHAMNGDYGLEELRISAASAALRVPEVSEWSVGMHIHHCCLATVGACRSLIASTPPTPRSGFSLVRAVVFSSGRIPRGRGRSPDVVLPRQDVAPDELCTLLDQSEQILAEARDLDPRAWFRHSAFGVLDRDKTLRFILIHNRHHLRIISDIVAA